MSGMRQIKILKCDSCGCDRKVLVKPQITRQDGENKFVMDWSRMCINCFVRFVLNSDLGMSVKLEGSNLLKALECIKDDE